MKPLRFPAHEAALEYLELGLSFYPKKPGTKIPYFSLLPRDAEGKRGWGVYRERQPTEQEAANWFRRKPHPNIAIITGKICVLDLDTPEAFEFCAQHGGWPEQDGLPATPTVRSRRGMHLYFLAPAIELRADAIPGADLLSGGKCCTAPPSVHECGHVYRWITPLSVGFQPLPSWIEEIAKVVPRVPRPPRVLTDYKPTGMEPEEIKSRCNIVDVVGQYVELRKTSGENFKGLCPFHDERSASFVVHGGEGYYKCFGCGKSGDVFDFLQRIKGISFYQAKMELAAGC